MASDMLSPNDAYSLWDSVPGALLRAAQELLWDFSSGDMKSWAYYPGVFTGVLACNELGLGAVIYVVGSAVDIIYRTGPDASDIAYFVDGVAQTDISAYAAAEAWETLHIGDLIDGVIHSIELRSTESAAAPGNESVFSLANVTVTGEEPRAVPFSTFLISDTWEVSNVVEDAKGQISTHSYYLPSSFSYDDVVYFAQDYAHRASELVGGIIKDIKVNRRILPQYLPDTPLPESDVEETMTLVYGLEDPNLTFRHSLATWRSDYTRPDISNERRVPTDDTEVFYLTDLMLGAQALGYPSNPCDRRGMSVANLKDAYQVFKKSRNKANM